MKLEEAIKIAAHVFAYLAPYCEKIEVAGSIRRKKPNVKDIEIVCVPKEVLVMHDLFNEDVTQRDPRFVCAVNVWPKVKGEPTGRHTQRIIPYEDGKKSIKLDLFMCRPDNFGVIFAIRTGPADFSQNMIAKRAYEVYMRIQGGMLIRNGEALNVPDEETLFKYLQLPYMPPEERI